MQDFIDTLINGPARYTQANNLSDGWTLLVILGALLIEICLIIYLLRLLFVFVVNIPSLLSFLLRLFGVARRDESYVFMQLTFPADTSKSAYATEQLHILLRSLVGYRNIWERFAARKQPYSLEVVATKDEGIRYVIRVLSSESEQVHSMLLSFLPGLKVKMIDDYMDDIDGQVCSAELMLAGDYVLPLGVNKTLNEHDPVAYLTGHMRNLQKGEIAAYQIVAVPVFDNTHRILLRRIRRFRDRIARRIVVASELMNERHRIRRIFLISVFFPLYILAKGLKFIGQIISTILHNDMPEEWKSTVSAQAPLNPYEQELGASVKEKLDQSLFEVSLRVLVLSPDGNEAEHRLESLVTSFGTFTSTNQAVVKRRGLFAPKATKTIARFINRSLTPHILTWPTILSSSEMSDLYHFPNTSLTKTEGLVKSRSRDLPAPLSMKHSNAKLDVVVGFNEFGGQEQAIGMTLKQRQKHAYVIGKTGTGKTTLLMNAIRQDMENGKGVAVLDPHGDMFRELLSMVPADRVDDVVVFDPSDREHTVGLNILDPGIDFADRCGVAVSGRLVVERLLGRQNWRHGNSGSNDKTDYYGNHYKINRIRAFAGPVVKYWQQLVVHKAFPRLLGG